MTLAGFLVCGRQKLMDNSRVVFSLPSVSLALPARRTTRGNDDGAAEDGHSLKMAGTPPETDGDRHMMHGPIRRRCRHLFNAHHWMQGVWPVSTTTVYYGVYRREVHVLLPVQTGTVVTVPILCTSAYYEFIMITCIVDEVVVQCAYRYVLCHHHPSHQTWSWKSWILLKWDGDFFKVGCVGCFVGDASLEELYYVHKQGCLPYYRPDRTIHGCNKPSRLGTPQHLYGRPSNFLLLF